MLPRRPVRWLIRVAILLSLLSLVVFLYDVKYDFLPSSIQSHLLLHPDDPIIVDVEIRECKKYIGTCAKVLEDGKRRIDKDLWLDRSWTKRSYLYFSQVNETEIQKDQKVLTGLAVGPWDPLDDGREVPHFVREDVMKSVEGEDIPLGNSQEVFDMAERLGWQLRNEFSLGLWVKLSKHVPNKAATGLKVLYGESVQMPVEHWHLTGLLPLGRKEEQSQFAPRLAFRIGRKSADKGLDKPLKFKKEGNFKILQIADLHMSTGDGTCDQPATAPSTCVADQRTKEFMESVLDIENPDFVVFTGDQIFGGTSPDPETALLKALGPTLQRGIPWAMVWGNHDDQGPATGREMFDMVKDLPGAKMNDVEGVSGSGNYVTTVEASGSEYPSLTMYFIDSHGDLPSKGGGYDFIKEDQNRMLENQSHAIKEKLKGYAHIPLSMAFFHIPLQEYFGPVELRTGGIQKENVMSSAYNSGTLEVLRNIGVSVLSVGHDHVNDYCQLSPAAEGSGKDPLWLCYGGGAGFGGYGGYPDSNGNYKRRLRVFDINMDIPYIDTWHRVEQESLISNRVRLVDNGVPVLPFSARD